MKRYHIILDYLFQEKIRKPFSFRILNARIRKEKDDDIIKNLKKAYEVIENSL